MQQSYKIPLHHCQWCYKTTGRFIIDCLCIACQSCFNIKKSWVDQTSKCFYCQKTTQRKYIDLKVNPQQGGIYFQNLNLSMKNVLKIHEFQSEVSNKYCKHLEKKVFKLQTVIKTFIKQFPQYQPFFQGMMNQMEQKQNNNFRSKSVNQTDSQSSQGFGKILFHSNTEKNIQKPNPHIRSNNKTGYFEPQNKVKVNPPSEKNFVNSHQFQDYQQKKNKNIYSITGRKQTESGREGYFQNNNLKFGNQQKVKNPNYQQSYDNQSVRSYQSSAMVNGNKNQVPIQIYHVGGNNKFSDPTKQQVNLNNINMQTALRSIKSDDGRDNFLPFYQNNQIDPRRNNKRNQPMMPQNIESPKNVRNPNADQFVFQHKKGPK